MRAAGRAEATPRVAKAKEDEKASQHRVGDLFRAEYLRYEAQIKAIDVGAGGKKSKVCAFLMARREIIRRKLIYNQIFKLGIACLFGIGSVV